MTALPRHWKAILAAVTAVVVTSLGLRLILDREPVVRPGTKQEKRQGTTPGTKKESARAAQLTATAADAPQPWSLPKAELRALEGESTQRIDESVPSFADLQSRIEADGVDSVIASLSERQATPAVERLRQALDLSRHILRDHPRELWFQLFARTRMADNLAIDQMLRQSPSRSRLVPRFIAMDQAGGPLVRVMSADNFGVLSVAVSPTGDRVVSGHGDGTLTMWRLQTGQPIWSVKGHDASVDGVAYAPNAQWVSSASNDKSVVLWDAESGERRQSITIASNGAYAVDFSPDSQTLAIGCDGFATGDKPDDVLTIWNFSTGQKRVLRGHKLNVKGVDFSTDGKRLVSGSHDKTLRFWDVDQGMELQSIEAFQDAVSSVAWANDGQTVAASSFFDPEIRLFSSGGNDVVGVLRGHRQGVTQLAFSADGRQLASAGQEGRVKLWDVATRQSRGLDAAHTDVANAIAFTPDGRFIVSGSSDKSIRVWNVAADFELTPPSSHGGSVHAVALSADETLLATGGADGSIRIVDVRTGAERKQMAGRFEMTSFMAFSPDGGELATLHGDRILRIWDVANGKVRMEWTGPKHANHDPFPSMSRLTSCAFSPDGRYVAVGGNRTLNVLDRASRQVVFDLQGHENLVHSLAFSPDGLQLASSSGDRTVRLWNMASGELNRRIKVNSFARQVAFAPDGKSLIVGGSGKTIEQLSASSGELMRTFQSPEDVIDQFSWIADGRVLVTVDFRGTIYFWDIASGKVVDRYHLDQRFSTFAGLPSGLLAGAGMNGRIHVYQWTTDKIVEARQGR